VFEIEQTRLLIRLKNRIFLMKYLKFLSHKIFIRIKKTWFSPVDYYPQDVKNKVELLHRRVENLGDIGDYEFYPRRIHLASKFIDVISEEVWKQEFEDLEDLELLHRWNWLLYMESSGQTQNRTVDWGWGYIRSWIKENGIGKEGSQSEPYTIAERIVNTCIYTWTINRTLELPSDISEAIELMAYKLADSLEYNEPGSTGNHIFNNARGLYFAGETLGNQSLVDLAVAIFKDRIDILVSKDGFFTEGSSHYHMLFTRWLFEIIWLAEMQGDLYTQNLLKPYLKRLSSMSSFFIVYDEDNRSTMPLIGDISPDYPPEWLFTIPRCKLREKNITCDENLPLDSEFSWHKLFDCNNQIKTHYKDKYLGEAYCKIQTFAESYWHRYDWFGWTLFLHSIPGSCKNQAGHFHEDLTSFVLFRYGKEVFVDPGRRSYSASDVVARFQKSSIGHNSLMLNGVGPGLMPNQQRYPEFYRDSDVSVTHEINDKLLFVELRHTGFSRAFSSVGSHLRKFSISKNSIEIFDEIEGSKSAVVDSFFHLSPFADVKKDTQSNNNKINFSLCERNYEFESININSKSNKMDFKINLSEQGHVISRSYGDSSMRSSCISVHGNIQLPYRHRFRLKLL
jgi:hypothetical protein